MSVSDLAQLCGVEEHRLLAWESADPRRRAYPSVDELVDLCFRTETALEEWLDLVEGQDAGQLELPGLGVGDGNELTQALVELEAVIARVQPEADEVDLLAAFRKAPSETRRAVMRTLGL
ncbi:XRE family transcriptional regulator [Marinobacter sp. SS21]|uniref:XRE family transcriptional regulator n=1 Tax=Marinobacter sp. SS21 TaxID=2979460 RepID=UPI00232B3A83|nr:XRE family transcriptional regulator [Marinobacter sp. SS21]MDC0661966.1 XRE family transcriptional regulator [Marinobacter sp. SS21]